MLKQCKKIIVFLMFIVKINAMSDEAALLKIDDLSRCLEILVTRLEQEEKNQINFFDRAKQSSFMNTFAFCVTLIQVSKKLNEKFNKTVQAYVSDCSVRRILLYTNGLCGCSEDRLCLLLDKIKVSKTSNNSNIIMFHIIGGYTEHYGAGPTNITYYESLHKSMDFIKEEMLITMTNSNASIRLQDVFDWLFLNRKVAEPKILVEFLNNCHCELRIENGNEVHKDVITKYLLANENCNCLMKPKINEQELSADTVLVFKSLDNINNEDVQNSILLNKD
ncbi:MAG TPA: hypothetical protein VL201_00045 [Patescibacteria group bacterium]|jgi:hypothetical protein|nr:hypothetical protein [Patescibacteria group bacterium]